MIEVLLNKYNVDRVVFVCVYFVIFDGCNDEIKGSLDDTKYRCVWRRVFLVTSWIPRHSVKYINMQTCTSRVADEEKRMDDKISNDGIIHHSRNIDCLIRGELKTQKAIEFEKQWTFSFVHQKWWLAKHPMETINMLNRLGIRSAHFSSAFYSLICKIYQQLLVFCTSSRCKMTTNWL